jgi:hypothetical protein
MSAPLPESVVEVLRSDATAALGALLVIAQSYGDLLAWAASLAGTIPSAPRPCGSRPRKSNGHKRHGRSSPDETDKTLLEAMEADPSSNIGELAAAIGKSKTTVVTALNRSRDAGRAESIDRRWRLVEEAPRTPPTPWVEAVSGRTRAHAHA